MLRNQGMIWASDGQKMSKSKGNVVTPDAMVEKYGADALRLWELFMGPFEEATNWNEEGVFGTARYLDARMDVVRRYVEAGCASGQSQRRDHQARAQDDRTVTDHIERMRFNTALATLMDQLNYIAKLTPEELGRFAHRDLRLYARADGAAHRARSSGASSAMKNRSISNRGRSSIPR